MKPCEDRICPRALSTRPHWERRGCRADRLSSPHQSSLVPFSRVLPSDLDDLRPVLRLKQNKNIKLSNELIKATGNNLSEHQPADDFPPDGISSSSSFDRLWLFFLACGNISSSLLLSVLAELPALSKTLLSANFPGAPPLAGFRVI